MCVCVNIYIYMYIYAYIYIYISATVPLGTSGVSLRSLAACWSAFCRFFKGATGRLVAWSCVESHDFFSHVFQVSFPSAFRTSIFRDLSSQDPDLGPKMTSKSEPGGTPETTKN